MLRTLSTLFAIRSSSAVNRFIYYAQRLPIIGRKIGNTAYANLEAKRAIAVIAFLITVAWGLLTKFAYLGLMIYFPIVAFGEDLLQEDRLQLFLHIFLLISFVVASVTSASVLEPKREKYVAVRLMRMQPGAYMRTSLFYRYSTYFIYYIPAMLLFTSFMDVPVYQGVTLAASVTLWRVVSEYLHLKLFEKTGMVLIKNTGIVWLTIAIGYAAAYAPLFVDIIPAGAGKLLHLSPFVLVLMGAGILAAILLQRYADYRPAVDAATRRDDPLLNLGSMMAEANKKDVRSKESDYELTFKQSDKYNRLEGYAFLDALFFARHRSLIIQPVFKKMAIIGVAGVIAAFLAYVDKDRIASWAANLHLAIPYFILAMNFLTNGERACRAMFYNCDLSMMRYSFYRKAAGRHFRHRLYRMSGLNLMIAAVLGGAVTLFSVVAGGVQLGELLLTLACIAALAVFFSIHHLFMYYMLQPYSTDLNVKNPFFFLISLVVSFACGISIVIKASALTMAVILTVLTVVYLIVALVSVRKFGHRTFRVK